MSCTPIRRFLLLGIGLSALHGVATLLLAGWLWDLSGLMWLLASRGWADGFESLLIAPYFHHAEMVLATALLQDFKAHASIIVAAGADQPFQQGHGVILASG